MPHSYGTSHQTYDVEKVRKNRPLLLLVAFFTLVFGPLALIFDDKDLIRNALSIGSSYEITDARITDSNYFSSRRVVGDVYNINYSFQDNKANVVYFGQDKVVSPDNPGGEVQVKYNVDNPAINQLATPHYTLAKAWVTIVFVTSFLICAAEVFYFLLRLRVPPYFIPVVTISFVIGVTCLFYIMVTIQ